VEREPESLDEEPGLKEFRWNPSLSGDGIEEEIQLPRMLRFKGKRSAPLYYYWEL